jgi:hypothetical protein
MYHNEHDARVYGFAGTGTLQRQAYQRGKPAIEVGTVLALVTVAATLAAFVVSLMH